MMDLGFYLTDCTASEKHNGIINTINAIITNHPYDNVVLFNNTYNRIDSQKKFPIFHINQAKYFDGSLIHFDMESAIFASNFPGPKKQALICDDTDWYDSAQTRAVFWKEIYENSNISFFTNKQDIKKLLKICWDVECFYLNNLDDKELYNAIKSI